MVIHFYRHDADENFAKVSSNSAVVIIEEDTVELMSKSRLAHIVRVCCFVKSSVKLHLPIIYLQIWNVHSVLNVLHSLVDKSNINRQLEVYTSGGR